MTAIIGKVFITSAVIHMPTMSPYLSVTPEGKVDLAIEMPVKKVARVMFGRPNMDVLNVTSMAKPPLPRFPGDGVPRGSLFAIAYLGMEDVAESRLGA
jgi:L-arabinonolactonase